MKTSIIKTHDKAHATATCVVPQGADSGAPIKGKPRVCDRNVRAPKRTEIEKLLGFAAQRATELVKACKASSGALAAEGIAQAASDADWDHVRYGLEQFAEKFVLGGGSLDEIAAASIWAVALEALGGGAIQLSWEYEVAYDDEKYVARVYRPADMTEAEWDKVPEDQQIQMLHDRAGHSGDIVRRADAEEFFSQELEFDSTQWFESKCASWVTNLDDLMTQVRVAQAKLGPNGRFHFHVTFPWTGALQKHAPIAQAVLQRGNEYTTYGWLCGMSSWTNECIRPDNMRSSTLQYIGESMAKGGSDVRNSDEKMVPLAWRTWVNKSYKKPDGSDDENRVGFELRSIRHVPSVFAIAFPILESLVRLVMNPETALVKFGQLGTPYRARDIETGDWISEETYERLEPDVKRFFDSARKLDGVEPDEKLVWALPVVALEDRKQVPPKSKVVVRKARKSFYAEVRKIAAKRDAGLSDEETVTAIRWAVSSFCRNTKVAWQYL